MAMSDRGIKPARRIRRLVCNDSGIMLLASISTWIRDAVAPGGPPSEDRRPNCMLLCRMCFRSRMLTAADDGERERVQKVVGILHDGAADLSIVAGGPFGRCDAAACVAWKGSGANVTWISTSIIAIVLSQG